MSAPKHALRGWGSPIENGGVGSRFDGIGIGTMNVELLRRGLTSCGIRVASRKTL
jgi:hypothetical protein